jgi:hypothetical protein
VVEIYRAGSTPVTRTNGCIEQLAARQAVTLLSMTLVGSSPTAPTNAPFVQ